MSENLHFDLHCHSTASDGTLTPVQLVHKAAESGVDVLALTDHDTTEGYAEARREAERYSLKLIPGVEVSVTWNRRTVHILGLDIDPENVTLQQGLGKLREFRSWRAEEIGRRLEKHGVVNAFEGAKKYSNGRLISRTHFARYLHEQGKAKTLRDVFKHYLVHNKPGYVAGQWAQLQDAVSWIMAAGGNAVIAHPARYGLTATKLRELIRDFKEAGGVGFEVISGSHKPQEQENMFTYANRFELYTSCGSDYHGPENPWIELGKLDQIPRSQRPIWQLWDIGLAANIERS